MRRVLIFKMMKVRKWQVIGKNRISKMGRKFNLTTKFRKKKN